MYNAWNIFLRVFVHVIANKQQGSLKAHGNTKIQNQEKLKFLGHMKKKGWENLTLTGHTERKKDSDLPTRRACVNGWRNGGGTLAKGES